MLVLCIDLEPANATFMVLLWAIVCQVLGAAAEPEMLLNSCPCARHCCRA